MDSCYRRIRYTYIKKVDCINGSILQNGSRTSMQCIAVKAHPLEGMIASTNNAYKAGFAFPENRRTFKRGRGMYETCCSNVSSKMGAAGMSRISTSRISRRGICRRASRMSTACVFMEVFNLRCLIVRPKIEEFMPE